jgi:hypothetical protein
MNYDQCNCLTCVQFGLSRHPATCNRCEMNVCECDLIEEAIAQAEYENMHVDLNDMDAHVEAEAAKSTKWAVLDAWIAATSPIPTTIFVDFKAKKVIRKVRS